MKKTGVRALILHRIYWALLATLILLVAVLGIGTIYGVMNRTRYQDIRTYDALSYDSGFYRQGQTFTGIGQLRIPTADIPTGIVILFVSFNYYPDDRAFSEELVLKIGEFRDIIGFYIGSFSIEGLRQISEESIKADLLNKFNSVLRLGQIDSLLFNDFLIIE